MGALTNIFSRRARRAAGARSFADLSRGERLRVVRRVIGANGYAGFHVVKGPDELLRARGQTETEGEDAALTYYERTKIANLARNGVRNSETLNTILKQFEVNVVGTVGGKASFVMKDAEQSAVVREAFARYCRSIEFFDGLSFGEVLKRALTTYLIGGDFVLLFDEFSHKIIAFEPDCIANLPDDFFRDHFPAGYTQRQGRIYNSESQFCGVICSHAQRGRATFRPYDDDGNLAVFILARDPNGDPVDEDWVMIRHAWRFNQGRGTPPVAASLGSIIDLEDVTKFEVQAAKYNAQVIGQIYQTAATDKGVLMADGIDPNAPVTDWSKADEAAIAAAVAEAKEEGDDFTFDEIRGAGVIFNKMPASAKMEILDTKHPNQNMPEFIRWLAGRAAASLGVGSVYATMKADSSYTAFRGEQVMSWPAFEELQKFLEQNVCDWVLAHWARTFPEAASLPRTWMHSVAWQWPKMREVNQVDEQTAQQMRLKNLTGSFREIYGADWRDRLNDVAVEIDYCRDHNIPHPALITVSGTVVDDADKKKDEDKNEDVQT